ncbi:hypothetical protein CY35_17G022800 [Sphagnum magellanicum]|nr:hypothetical protein CY35_17G022800 [Sphagnum magellanicum]KAH9534805.1 hypothetical protein CY35_17G022800 [Sphagnum magellanicum]
MKAEEEMHRGETTPEREPGPMLNELGWKAMEYVLMWPFMCHIASVFVVAWIASLLHFHVFFIFLLGLMYLYQIENRQRKKLCRSIRHEERKNCYKMRLSEGETVRWMNHAVERMWPLFLENFASQMLLLPLSPWFLNMFKPWTAKKAIVQHLYLGKNPPIITMVRALEDCVDGDHLMMEAAMEFGASQDMSAVLAVQIRRRLGLGIWTSFHISNVHLEGKVKIGVKFVDGWPVIGRIRLCFTTAPFLQMTARPLFNAGVDVTEIPGIAQWLDRIIAFALEQSLVEPNMLVVDVEKLVSELMFPPPPSQEPKQADWFHMEEKPPVATVVLEILEAAALRSADLNGLSDPFVKGTLSMKKFSTKIIWKTLNPKWDEKFELPIASWELPNLLMLKIFDKDHFHNDDLGFCVVPINDYQDGERHDLWLPLQDVKTGKIHLAITVTNHPAATTNYSDKPTNSSNDPPSDTSGSQVECQELKTKDTDRNLPISTTEMALPESSDGQMRATYSIGNNSIKRRQASGQTMAHASSNDKLLDKAKSSAHVESHKLSAGQGDSTSGTAVEGSKQTTAPRERQIEAGKQTGDQRKAVVDIGLGLQPGTISIVQLGDEKSAEWPCQNKGRAKAINTRTKQERVDNPLMGKFTLDARGIGDENSDAGALKPEVPAQKHDHKNAGLFHRGHKHLNEQTTENVHFQDVSSASCAGGEHVAVAPNGTVAQMVIEGFHKHATDNADKSSAEDGDPSAHHKRSKAKGFLNMAEHAAIRMGQSLSRRFKSKKHTESAITNGQGSFSSAEGTPRHLAS